MRGEGTGAGDPEELADSEVLFLGVLGAAVAMALLGAPAGLLNAGLGMLLMGFGAQLGVLAALPLLWALVQRRGRLHRPVWGAALAVYGLVAAMVVGATLF